jgi:sugar lactone lactonase YvrE
MGAFQQSTQFRMPLMPANFESKAVRLLRQGLGFAGGLLVASAFGQSDYSPPYTFLTFAGVAGAVGTSDGTGTAASFDNPNSVAVDGSGNLYVADTYNDTIRKITPAGAVTTLAGTPAQSGSLDGIGAAALFDNPCGVAVDTAGNVYAADSDNDTIRKIAPDGTVTTLAGTPGRFGSTDGAPALFNYPSGIAVDGPGNVYVADLGNNTIRKITPNGIVTTLAGTPGQSGGADGTGGTAQFDFPYGLAADAAGNIYVADLGNDTIRKITPDGAVTTLAGAAGQSGSADGAGNAARFNGPSGVAVDGAGNVYVADTDNDIIREITPGGTVTTLAGVAGQFGGTDGTGSAALFGFPGGVAVDGAGNLYAADSGNSTIRKGTAASGPIPAGPAITTQPASQILNSGSTVVFTGAAPEASSYQWNLNGKPLADSAAGISSDAISGATGPQLVITGATRASNGSYTLVATDSSGSTNSGPATLQTTLAANPGAMTSLSARGFVGAGDDILISGFYIAGSTSRTVLVQAMGPALAALGVADALQQPALSIHQNQNGQDVTLYSNTGWGSSQVLLGAAASVFASPVLATGSADSELLVTLPPGGYSAEVSGAEGGTGVALCAVYELP